jgi:hypothetical protein
MNENQSFDPKRINELINAINDSNVVNTVTNDITAPLSGNAPSPLAQRRNIQIRSTEDVYHELSNLINVSYELLDAARYALETNPEGEGVISGISAMIDSIRDLLREFIKIQTMSMRFDQMKELEILKTQCKKELLQMKLNAVADPNSVGKAPIDMYEFNQEKIITSILAKEKKTIEVESKTVEETSSLQEQQNSSVEGAESNIQSAEASN